MKLPLLIAVSLAVTCVPVSGQYYQNNRYDYAEPPRGRSNKMFGLVKNGFFSAVAGYGFGQVYHRWQQGRIKKAFEKKTEKLKHTFENTKEAVVTRFGEQFRNLEENSDILDRLIAQLEGVLHDPDTDPSKRKIAEFKLPDANNDDNISRAEFHAYLRSYFAAHPDLVEENYPSFDDFDLNKDGKITFSEWEGFIKSLEAEQAKHDAEEAKQAAASARDYATRR